jgi:hypothetical protein
MELFAQLAQIDITLDPVIHAYRLTLFATLTAKTELAFHAIQVIRLMGKDA